MECQVLVSQSYKTKKLPSLQREFWGQHHMKLHRAFRDAKLQGDLLVEHALHNHVADRSFAFAERFDEFHGG